MSAEYSAVLRRAGTDTVSISRVYITALTLVRTLVREEDMPAAETVAAIRDIFGALAAAQVELDTRET